MLIRATLATGNMAISTAPFFQDVPDRALSGILTPGGVEREPLLGRTQGSTPTPKPQEEEGAT